MWLIRATYIFGIIIFVFGYMFWLRNHNAKTVIGKVFCTFRTSEGNTYTKLIQVEDGILSVKPKKDKKGKAYAIADIACSTIDYPPAPRILAFIQTKCRWTVFDEDSAEPLLNRSSALILNPARLYNIINQRFTEIGVSQSREELEHKAKQQQHGLSTTAIILMLLGVAVIAGGWYVMQNLESLKAATGIG